MPSLQVVPSGLALTTQVPVAASQPLVVHSLEPCTLTRSSAGPQNPFKLPSGLEKERTVVLAVATKSKVFTSQTSAPYGDAGVVKSLETLPAVARILRTNVPLHVSLLS